MMPSRAGLICPCLTMAMVVGLPAAAFSQLSLERQTVAAGGVVVAPVTLALGNTPPSALQFDIVYPAEAVLSATLPDAVAAGGKSLFQAAISPTRKRFLIAGPNLNQIADGAILDLVIAVAPTAAARDAVLKFANAVAAAADGSEIPLSAQDTSLSIGAGSAGSALSAWGVRNAASLETGPVAPGEFVSFFGTGANPIVRPPYSGMTVTVNGFSAPLLYVGENQINAVVPFEIAGTSPAIIAVSYLNQPLGTASMPVAAAAPGIFALDGSGKGQGAILNESGAVNSPAAPADRGSSIVIFATGAGQMTPPPSNGQIISGGSQPIPVLPVSVTIDGLDAPVSYAGAASGLMAGALQVNCQVPPGSQTGPAVPVLIRMAGYSSQNGLTMAIK